jgi:hypothetical protein
LRYVCPKCGSELEPDPDRAPTRVFDLDSLRARLEEEKRAAPHDGQVWYVGVEKRSVGPLTAAGMEGLLARGQLRRGSLVWREGWPSWTTAENIPELRTLLGLPQPPTLPEEGPE